MEPHLCSEVGPNHSVAILQSYYKLFLGILLPYSMCMPRVWEKR